MKRIALVLAAAIACGCEVHVDPATEVGYLQAPGTEDPGLPFSSAVGVDNTLYLSGAIAVILGTLELAEGGTGRPN